MAEKSKEEGEIGSESREKGDLPPCSPPPPTFNLAEKKFIFFGQTEGQFWKKRYFFALLYDSVLNAYLLLCCKFGSSSFVRMENSGPPGVCAIEV